MSIFKEKVDLAGVTATVCGLMPSFFISSDKAKGTLGVEPLHHLPQGHPCKTEEKFLVNPSPMKTQLSARAKLLIAVKMHQNLDLSVRFQ